jgi:hypothetical protein
MYKSLKDTWLWKLGLRPRYSQMGIYKRNCCCSVCCWAMGTNKVRKCAELPREAKERQKSISQSRQAEITDQERTPFICTPRVPICLSFNSEQGLPLSGLSGGTRPLQLPSKYKSYPPPPLQLSWAKRQSGPVL